MPLFCINSGGIIQNFPSLKVSDGKNVQETPGHQGVASSFPNKNIQILGLGYLPTSTRFDPTYEFEYPLHNLLIPSNDEALQAPRLRIFGEKPGLQIWGETESGGTTFQFQKFFENYPGLELNGQTPLLSRNLGIGIATGSSYEDAHFRPARSPTGLFEFKGGEKSALEAVLQGVSEGSNCLMGLRNEGIPVERCIIPLIGTNGFSVVFGAMIMLDETFPTYVPLSKLLDLQDPVEREVASAFLLKAANFCQTTQGLLLKLQSERSHKAATVLWTKMELTLSKYFVKYITDDVYERGFGMFIDNGGKDRLEIQAGIDHMIEALNLVYASPDARRFVEFPLSIRTPDNCSTHPCFELIYRDLAQLGFVTGAPNRITEEALYLKYCDRVDEAVAELHKAGVLHVDLYLSNIMFRRIDEATDVTIKIVDTDAMHCLKEKKFIPVVYRHLVNYLGPKNVEFGEKHDLLYISVLRLPFEPEDAQLLK